MTAVQPGHDRQACGDSTDLTPGVVWTEAQLVVLRGLLGTQAEVERLRAKVARVEALTVAWEDETCEWYYANRHTHESGIDYVLGYADGWDHADELVRRALTGEP